MGYPGTAQGQVNSEMSEKQKREAKKGFSLGPVVEAGEYLEMIKLFSINGLNLSLLYYIQGQVNSEMSEKQKREGKPLAKRDLVLDEL